MFFSSNRKLLMIFVAVLFISSILYSIVYTSYFRKFRTTQLDIRQLFEYDIGNDLDDTNVENTTQNLTNQSQYFFPDYWKTDENSTFFLTGDVELLPSVSPGPSPYILSLDDFTHTINNPCVCNATNPPVVLLVVISAPRHRNRRIAIRETWGLQVKLSKHMAMLFMLGLDVRSEENQKIVEENNHYSDVVQGTFIDHYRNLTWKSLMMLRWVRDYCFQTKYLLKIDDDVFINVQNLWNLIVTEPPSKSSLTGRLATNWKAIRNVHSKWFISKSEFPNALLPDFLTGPAYIVGGEVIEKLLTTCLRLPYFFLEDVFITGMCAFKANIPITHNNKFTNSRKAIDMCRYDVVISVHSVTQEEMRIMWKRLLSNNGKLILCRKLSHISRGNRYRRRFKR